MATTNVAAAAPEFPAPATMVLFDTNDLALYTRRYNCEYPFCLCFPMFSNAESEKLMHVCDNRASCHESFQEHTNLAAGTRGIRQPVQSGPPRHMGVYELRFD